MRIIIHQHYRNLEGEFIIESIKGEDIIIKSRFGTGIYTVKLDQFEKEFEESFDSGKVLKAKNGCNYFKVGFSEMLNNLSGAAICDSCGTLAINNENKTANLIPVLNSVYCNKCFTKWESISKMHKEDIPYEQHKTDFFIELLNQ